jgi:hypothetical protein
MKGVNCGGSGHYLLIVDFVLNAENMINKMQIMKADQ